MTNLYDYLLSGAPDEKLAVCSRHEQVTYGELIAMAEAIAAMLKRLDVQAAERVALLADNSAYWIASYLAVLKIGAVAVPIPQRLSPETFIALIKEVQCTTFCADLQRYSKYSAVFPPESCILLPYGSSTIQGDNRVRVLEAVPRESCPTVDVCERETLAALMFTSGSTGQPNAVKISHHNIMANTDSIVSFLGLTTTDTMMVVLPFDYCFGTSLLHTHLRVGGTLVINNTFAFIETVVDDLEQFACTGIAGVPTVYQHLLRRSSFTRRSLPSLRQLQQAGGKLPDILMDELTAAFPQARLFVMYGQTEATARLSYLPPEHLHDKRGSIGRGIPGVRLQILDEHDQPVEPGQVGEIVAQGDNVALGYWQPDPTKNPFRDGKLYTGDLARVDSDGFMYIVGRSSEFLKLSGHRISAKEIEDALYGLPDVLEAAVIGTQDGDAGEIAAAYLVIRNEAGLTTDQVIRHCKARLPPYAVPHKIEFLAELPKNSAGKILKTELPKG